MASETNPRDDDQTESYRIEQGKPGQPASPAPVDPGMATGAQLPGGMPHLPREEEESESVSADRAEAERRSAAQEE